MHACMPVKSINHTAIYNVASEIPKKHTKKPEKSAWSNLKIYSHLFLYHKENRLSDPNAEKKGSGGEGANGQEGVGGMRGDNDGGVGKPQMTRCYKDPGIL